MQDSACAILQAMLVASMAQPRRATAPRTGACHLLPLAYCLTSCVLSVPLARPHLQLCESSRGNLCSRVNDAVHLWQGGLVTCQAKPVEVS
eukprot:6173636-Pleurochrysis_carterae.AAC.1